MDEGEGDDERDSEVVENALLSFIVGAGGIDRKMDGVQDEGAEQDRSEVVEGRPADDDDVGDDCREASDASQRDMTADGATSVGPVGSEADVADDVIQDVRAVNSPRRVVFVIVTLDGAFDEPRNDIGSGVETFFLVLANLLLPDTATRDLFDCKRLAGAPLRAHTAAIVVTAVEDLLPICFSVQESRC